jgi:polar amino acid transport system permease protein
MSGVLDALGPLSAGIVATIVLTAGAFTLGAVIGVPVAAARASRFRVARIAGGAYVELLRGIPPIGWLFIIYYGLAELELRVASLPAAIIGLGLVSSAYLAEIYRAGLRAVPHGQWEAGRAVGLRAGQLYRRVIAPQAIVTVLPPAATYAIGLLKDSAIASAIGAAEITSHALNENQRSAQGLSVFLAAALLYLAISLPLAGLTRGLDGRLSRRLSAA